jgi:hypothetical protein
VELEYYFQLWWRCNKKDCELRRSDTDWRRFWVKRYVLQSPLQPFPSSAPSALPRDAVYCPSVPSRCAVYGSSVLGRGSEMTAGIVLTPIPINSTRWSCCYTSVWRLRLDPLSQRNIDPPMMTLAKHHFNSETPRHMTVLVIIHREPGH